MKSEADSRNNDARVSLRKDGRISMTASPLSSGHAPATPVAHYRASTRHDTNFGRLLRHRRRSYGRQARGVVQVES